MLAQIVTENGVKKIQALTADTGTGAPVGSIIVVCSNILPSGYLGLGVQYDITNYPALYQVIGTDTTPTASALGLPTLSSGQYAIKATSGLTENQQENVLNTINENLSYSTEEHPTGKKWIDGKDIYSLVIINLSFTTGTRLTYNLGNNISTAWIDFTHSHVYGEYGIRQPWSQTDFYVDSGVINFETQHPSGYLCAVVEYTKTMDN